MFWAQGEMGMEFFTSFRVPILPVDPQNRKIVHHYSKYIHF